MFENIVGNNTIKNTLQKSYELNKTSHSYMFIGIQGIGKKLIANEFAKMILNHGEINNPDYIFIEPDEKGSIKIQQIRDIQKQIAEKPIISDKKVCIINDADLMTIEAQNCLLKTLEEPPEYMTIILIGSVESNFLPTIKSRCTIMYFEKIHDEDMKKYIKDNFDKQEIPSNLIEIADGSIGRAIKLKDKVEIYERINEVFKQIDKKDIIEVLKMADVLVKEKDEIFEILEYINVILIKLSKENYKFAKCIEIVEETKRRIKSNSNFNMCIDYMLLSIWEEVNEKYSRG